MTPGLALSLSPGTLGRPLAYSGPQFLLYSMSGEGMTLNFMTAPLGLKICILEPWESLPQKGWAMPTSTPCPPTRAALLQEEGSAEPWQRHAKASVRTGFTPTPTPLVSPHRPSALNWVAPGVQKEWIQA